MLTLDMDGAVAADQREPSASIANTRPFVAVDGIARLRAETTIAHRRIEAHPLSTRLMRPQVSVSDYSAFLRAQCAVSAAWASACPEALPDLLREEGEARLMRLREDLDSLGIACAPTTVFSFPEWPETSTQWWGALYVIEGARLGGLVIARHLRSSPATRDLDAFRFLDARPNRPWPRVLQEIGARLATPAEQRDALAGALRTFALFHLAFDLAGAPPRPVTPRAPIRLRR